MKILRIGAIWCPECAIMKFRWAEIEKELPELEIEDIDYDKNKDIKQKYQIEKASTFIFFDREGKELLRLSGLVEKQELLKIIRANQNK